MSALAPTQSRAKPDAAADACRYIIDFIYERSGIRLHQGKEALIQARLGKRIRQLGLPGLVEYGEFLRTQANADEFSYVVDALTTNFTSFLREESHLKFLVEEALPSLLAPGDRKIRLWSAASSTGEEPFSLAFYLAENFPEAKGWDWQITASDISTRVLEAARLGIYDQARLQGLPPGWLRRYFQKGTGRWEGKYRVKKMIAERVAFQRINLIDTYHHPEPFHVIFCRNVMIYFDRPTQERLVQQACRFLTPDGYFMVGHSECLNGLEIPLRCVQPSIYRRTGGAL